MANHTLRKLVVVDDDEDILTIMRHCLKSLSGVETRYLRSGEAAVREIPSFLPDLVLLDVMMPGKDGITTLKELRAIPSIEKTPVVLFTAKVMEGEMEDYRKLGVFDVIVKPFDPITFAANVLSLWERIQL